MSYRLKKGVESFEVVDGPLAGRAFLRGQVYEVIPRQEADKFEPIKKAASAEPKKAKAKTE